MATQVSGAETWLTLNDQPLSFRPDDHNLNADVNEFSRNYLKVTRHAPDRVQILVDGEPLETEVYGRWIWFPKGFAGLYELEITAPGHRSRKALVRVYPSKHSYERYQVMLSDISKIAMDLLFQVNSPASESLRLGRTSDKPSAIREYELIQKLIADMEVVFPYIERSPHQHLVRRSEERLVHEIDYFSPDVQPVPGNMLALAHRTGAPVLVSETWATQRAIPTYDVYENRLLKHFLWRQLIPRIAGIKDRVQLEIDRRTQDRSLKLSRGWQDDETAVIDNLKAVEENCDKMLKVCIQWGSKRFLGNVGALGISSAPTQVLQKHPYYHHFYRLYLRFQQQLRFSFNPDSYLHRISLRKLSSLYEIWSIFRMTEVLLSIFQKAGYVLASANGFFTLRDDQFHLELDRDAVIVLRGNGKEIRIRYEPAYPLQETVHKGIVATRGRFPLTPDLAVEVWNGAETETLLLFDAKYKWEDDGGSHVYLQDDLEKMYFYRREIRWKTDNPRMRPRSLVASAYVLYPGDVLEHDADYPEAGALPLLPNLDNPLATLRAIGDILKNANLL